MLMKIRNKLFYSVWIRYLIEGNLFITYEAIFFLKKHGSFSTTELSLSTTFRILILIILVLWIIFASFYIVMKQQNLEEPTFKRKFGSLYTGLNTNHRPAIMYTAVFCLRRLLLVLCLLWFDQNHNQVMIFVYIAIYSAFFIYLSHAKPNEEPSMNRLEHFNELCVIALHYTMLTFVYGTVIVPAMQWLAGNVAIGIIAIVFLVNMAYLVWSTVRKSIKWSRLRKIKKKKLNKVRLRKFKKQK